VDAPSCVLSWQRPTPSSTAEPSSKCTVKRTQSPSEIRLPAGSRTEVSSKNGASSRTTSATSRWLVLTSSV